MNTRTAVLTLSMLFSAYNKIDAQARYLNRDRIIQIAAKLKTLTKDTAKIETFEKNFKGSYVNSWFLLPREYNKIFALMLEFLDTTDHKPATQKDALLNVLEMLDEELKGLINRYGYRKELVALSQATNDLRIKVIKGPFIANPIYEAELKRIAQDLIAKALLDQELSKSIERCMQEHMKKKEKNEKKDPNNPPKDSDEKDRKP